MIPNKMKLIMILMVKITIHKIKINNIAKRVLIMMMNIKNLMKQMNYKKIMQY